VNVFYDNAYCDTSVAWETTRKADAVAAVLREGDVQGVELVSPSPLSLDELRCSVSEEYLNALRTGTPWDLAQSNSIGWDEKLLAAVCASNGGVRDAVLDALQNRRNAGSLSSGLHHARSNRGSGYCTVNGLVVAARAAVDAGAERVMILDLDAHCGGGTASSLESLPGCEQLDVAVNSFDSYSETDRAKLVVFDGRDYLDVVEREMSAVREPEKIDVLLYNAGMDPHEHAGGVRGVTTAVMQKREEMVFQWAAAHGIPVAWVLAGGYTVGVTMKELVDLHMITIKAARAR
jgi:acetoin utilization deacetylase AcuC-like enzyme